MNELPNSETVKIEEAGSNAPASLSGKEAPNGASDLGESSTPALAPAPAATLPPAPAATLPPAPAPAPAANLVDLDPPVNAPVKIINPEDDNDSIIAVPLTKQVIEVRAKVKGFFGQLRIRQGDVFSVPSFDALGDWMTCTDPEMEKTRSEFFRNKKKKKAKK